MARRSRVLLLAVAAVAAGALLIGRLLPPAARTLDVTAWPSDAPPVLRGAFHIHTTRSDGTGTMDEVARTAARAGLDFVIFTDHGDGTRAPEPPVYRAGVLALDGIEISTTGGHYLALDLPQTPYPLGGEPRDVVEDVARLGGLGIVAHPDSAKPELRWRDWTAPVDGLEWLNADSEWRDRPWSRLGRALLTFPMRGPETLAALVGRPVQTLNRWDTLQARRRLVALAGADAHARVGFGSASDPYESRPVLKVPSYETSFRAFSVHAVLDHDGTRAAGRDPTDGAAANGEASEEGARLLAAIREGRIYTVIDGLATPGRLDFSAASGAAGARLGQRLVTDGAVRFRARTLAPPGAEIILLRNGEPVHAAPAPELTYDAAPGEAAWRIEVRIPGAAGSAVPWILGNPIYVVPPEIVPAPPVVPPRLPPAIEQRLLSGPAGGEQDAGWTAEQDETSRAELRREADGVQLAYALGESRLGGPYAAAVAPLAPAGLARLDRVSFRARADRPMRISVQVRLPDGPDGQRWQRSVYLDAEPREVTVFFDEMTPAGRTDSRRPAPERADSLLFVVDTTHTRPGASGTVHLERVRLEAAGGEGDAGAAFGVAPTGAT
jgi:hypothetical protein